MEDEKRKTENKIKEVEAQILSNSKDAHFAKNLIQQLAGFYQMDKLIDVPLKDVKESIDFGACAIHKVKDGYVFVAKGGMETHVSLRMQSICTMLQTLFDLHNKEGKTDDDNALFDAFSSAIQYTFQAPIFSSLDEKALFQNATAILNSYTEFCTENYTNAEAKNETENDYKENAEAEAAAKALETLAESPLPPED